MLLLRHIQYPVDPEIPLLSTFEAKGTQAAVSLTPVSEIPNLQRLDHAYGFLIIRFEISDAVASRPP